MNNTLTKLQSRFISDLYQLLLNHQVANPTTEFSGKGIPHTISHLTYNEILRKIHKININGIYSKDDKIIHLFNRLRSGFSFEILQGNISFIYKWNKTNFEFEKTHSHVGIYKL